MRPEVLGEAAAMLEKLGLVRNTSCTETIRNHDACLQVHRHDTIYYHLYRYRPLKFLTCSKNLHAMKESGRY